MTEYDGAERSITECLRKLLDDRGVEYDIEDRPTVRYTDWGDWLFIEPLDAKPHTLGAQCELTRMPVTPEQAVEATLGRGTCKWEPADFITEGEWWKTSCDESFTWEPDGTPRYCPNCGREVE